MSKLYFRYSPMNAGKSTSLLQAAYNYSERGQRAVIAKPSIDTKSSEILSRLNVSAKVDWTIEPEHNIITDFFDKETEKVDCVLVDEAQFLGPEQIDQLFLIAVLYNVPVLAYGIKTDFKTRAFPGAIRLFELAHSIEEMKTICRCGSKALFNARKVNGIFTKDGDQVAIDKDEISYESLCGHCYIELIGW